MIIAAPHAPKIIRRFLNRHVDGRASRQTIEPFRKELPSCLYLLKYVPVDKRMLSVANFMLKFGRQLP